MIELDKSKKPTKKTSWHMNECCGTCEHSDYKTIILQDLTGPIEIAELRCNLAGGELCGSNDFPCVKYKEKERITLELKRREAQNKKLFDSYEVYKKEFEHLAMRAMEESIFGPVKEITITIEPLECIFKY